MTVEEYYTAPPQHVFDEIKSAAMNLWRVRYSGDELYLAEKIGRIENIQNVQDNAWYIVAMFDLVNQSLLLGMVSEETGNYIKRAMESN